MSAEIAAAPVGWGLVGCGWVARDFVVPALEAASSARLVAAFDPREEALAGLPSSVGRAPSLARLLAWPGVEAVYVATPNHLHAAHTVAAAAAGRHVLCEKPMALCADDAARMVEAMASAGRVYATAYDQRHHPAHERLRDWIADGRLGTVTQARIHYACWLPPGWAADNWRIDPGRAGGGAAVDLAPHGVDLLSLLLDEEPATITARLQRRVHPYPVDDGAVLTLAFPSGVLATLHVAYSCPEAVPRRRLEILGTGAMAVAEDTMGQTGGGRLTFIDGTTGRATVEDLAGHGAPFCQQIERFSRHLRGATDLPGSPDRDLRLTRRLLAAITAGAEVLDKEQPHAA